MNSVLEREKNALLDVYRAGVGAVEPGRLVREAVYRSGDDLICEDRKYRLQQNLVIVGAGKAVEAMLLSLLPLVEDHLIRAELSIPKDSLVYESISRDPRVHLHRGAAGNMPDELAEEAASRILILASSLTERHLMLVLLSGGGSALLSAPRSPLTIPLKRQLTQRLFNAGANITDVNTVRGAVSRSKQGRLARQALPATILTLVLSDVIDNPLDVIAGGPTWIPRASPKELAAKARQVLATYNVHCTATEQALDALENEPMVPPIAEDRIQHVVIGGLGDALRGAEIKARRFWPDSITLSTRVHGDADDTACALADLCSHLLLNTPIHPSLQHQLESSGVCPSQLQRVIDSRLLSRPLCLLLGGECSVKVRGVGGRGGRCQQMSLSAAARLHSLRCADGHVLLLFCGTDGADGPTDAAGALCHEGTAWAAHSQGVSVEQYLNENDSYGFFSRVDGGRWLVKTGPTGTNVMDLMLLLILPEGVNVPGPQ